MQPAGGGTTSAAAAEARLRYVTTAAQLGPVAYRDPLGVPSPDGRWLATTVGLHLRVEPLAGGPVRELGDGDRRVTRLAWTPDSRALAAREADRERTWSTWSLYDAETGTRDRLWPDKERFVPPGGEAAATVADVAELAFAPDGRIAALVQRAQGVQAWVLSAQGQVLEVRGEPGPLSEPTWTPDGRLACLQRSGSIWHLTLDCGRAPGDPDFGDVRGPFAFADDGRIYAGRPNDSGTLDLWLLNPAGPPGERLTGFTRDTYAPYRLADGRVLFKLQEYATTIARVDASGGAPQPVTTFQSETPSWNWQGSRIAFTFGSWRRVVDDARYPDIAQHLGVVPAGDGPAGEPTEVVRRSGSEDQGMHWSPNGRWIALHSHADGTDDIWLQPADGSRPAWPITGGGNESGWPRFSPDGRWIVYPTDARSPDGDRLGLLMLIGFDEQTGEVTQASQEIALEGFTGQVTFAEFGPGSERIFFEAMEGIGERSIRVVDRRGGAPERIHAFASEQWFSGISVSPDGAWVAYVAPAGDGRMQLFKVPAAGGEPVQLTRDPSDKTHPAWSPRGDAIAFTVFRYLAHFWLLEP